VAARRRRRAKGISTLPFLTRAPDWASAAAFAGATEHGWLDQPRLGARPEHSMRRPNDGELWNIEGVAENALPWLSMQHT